MFAPCRIVWMRCFSWQRAPGISGVPLCFSRLSGGHIASRRQGLHSFHTPSPLCVIKESPLAGYFRRPHAPFVIRSHWCFPTYEPQSRVLLCCPLLICVRTP